MDAPSVDRPRRWRISQGFGRAPRYVLAHTELGARLQLGHLTGIRRRTVAIAIAPATETLLEESSLQPAGAGARTS